MFDLQDNRKLDCFVLELKLDRDFKLAIYPEMNKLLFSVTNEINKTKEMAYQFNLDKKAAAYFEKNDQEKSCLWLELTRIVENYGAAIKKTSDEYSEAIAAAFKEQLGRLDENQKKNTGGERFEKQHKPYVDKAETLRKDNFQVSQKNLIHKLMWEPSTPTLELSSGKPIEGDAGHSTTTDNTNTETPKPKPIWFHYLDRWSPNPEEPVVQPQAPLQMIAGRRLFKYEPQPAPAPKPQLAKSDVKVECKPFTSVSGPEYWIDVKEKAGGLQVVDCKGNRFDVDASNAARRSQRAAVFQTCNTCKNAISRHYRTLKHDDLQAVFVQCKCGYVVQVFKSNGKFVGPLNSQFDPMQYV